jgi:HAD superfamily hydrolase (TIGR01509 family)
MIAEIDWSNIQLVVFDVDGTLYDQKAMRHLMLKEVLANVLRTGSLTVPRVLSCYRRFREKIAEEEIDGFDSVLITRTAKTTGLDEKMVRSLVSEWMEKRPLSHIRVCRYPFLDEIFATLKRQAKIIGVCSDYPAVEKLAAMDLRADYVVTAGDRDVGVLKPHPRGLQILRARAGVKPDKTVFIGDRPERDGEAARRACVKPLIRSGKPLNGWLAFSKYSDPVFTPLLTSRANHA